MSTIIRAPRWCENGNSCIYSNCPHRHERCAHFETGRCRHQKSMAKPADGGCMYDHRDASTLVEFVRNVRLYDYNDIMDVFEERGLVELIDTGDEMFSTAKMSTADRKLLVRSLKDGGFKFNVAEHSDEDGEVYDRIIDIFEIPGVGPFSPVYGPEPKPMELTEEDMRLGAMSAMEYNEYIVKRYGAPVDTPPREPTEQEKKWKIADLMLQLSQWVESCKTYPEDECSPEKRSQYADNIAKQLRDLGAEDRVKAIMTC